MEAGSTISQLWIKLIRMRRSHRIHLINPQAVAGIKRLDESVPVSGGCESPDVRYGTACEHEILKPAFFYGLFHRKCVLSYGLFGVRPV
jgi:hypothetical protein